MTAGRRLPALCGTWLAATLCAAELPAGNAAPFENLYREAYERRLRESGPEHPDTVASLVRLAALLRSHGRAEAAEPLLRQALSAQTAGASADTMVELAETLAVLGRHSEADGFYHRSLELAEAGERSARTLIRVARLRNAGGDPLGAKQAYRKALQHFEMGGPLSRGDRKVRATALNDLGLLLEAEGELAAAEKAYRESSDSHADAYGDRHPATAAVRANLASTLAVRGEAADAAALLEQSIGVIRAAYGPRHDDVARLQNRLGEVYEVLGRLDDAREQYLAALAVWNGPSPSRGMALTDLGRLAGVRGDSDAAETVLAEAVGHLQTAGEAMAVDLAEALDSYGSVLRGSGRLDEAEPLLRRALAIRETKLGASHPDVALSLVGLAGVFHLRGNLARAGPLYERALDIQERTLGPDHPEVGETLYNLAHVRRALGETASAVDALERAAGILSAAYGAGDPFLAEVLSALRALR